MSTGTLKEALQNCLINFDRRVLVTDLLQEYELTYSEVHEILATHISIQEQEGAKYEKRYLVHGEDNASEIFTIVQGETKLQEWLRKLKNAESSLYSVEVAGGAKAPAQIFKPVERCAYEVKSLKVRDVRTAIAPKANGHANENGKAAEVKKSNKLAAAFTKQSATAAASTSKNAANKSTEKPSVSQTTTSEEKPKAGITKKTSPEVKQAAAVEKKATSNKTKKSIGNFFNAAGAADTKTASKNTCSVLKPPTPKKVEDFFKKQNTKSAATVETKKEAANTSVQLFDDNEVEAVNVESSSSDEEEKLEVLNRDIISSDHMVEVDEAAMRNTKRPRIIESDDEDKEVEPQQKHEKIEETNLEAAVKSETFLDDDGFVITIKPKKINSDAAKTTKAKTSPPTSKATTTKKVSPKKVASKPKVATKTKQGNIMNFFTKK